MAIGFPVKADYVTGEVLTATNMNDLSGSVNLLQSSEYGAGRNALINGGFDIWQRSTSAATSTGTYPAPDRWWAYTNSGSATFSRESTIIPSGALYAGKITATSAGTQVFFAQAIETANLAPFINKTVTVSGQLAASTTVAHTLLVQYSTTVDCSNSGSWTTITASSTSGSLTPTSTTYVSFANTYAIPSNAKSLRVGFEQTSAIANGVVCYYGNIQLELGSNATTFSRAGATIQGELAACQRYYFRLNSANNSDAFMYVATGMANTANIAQGTLFLPTTMRTSPSLSSSGTWMFYNKSTISSTSSAITSDGATPQQIGLSLAGMTGLTAGDAGNIRANNNNTAFLEFSSEL